MNNKLDGGSLNIEDMEMEKLRSVFPQCFVEGKLDIDKLLSLCGEYIDNDFEKYKFEWKGKCDSLRLAQQRSMGTLRPCPEESIEWNTTQNLYIEGDNLEVLKLLQTAYYRKVKMIYIDPPYNTGNDFVYEDDFKDPINRYKEITAQTTKSNPETMGRYHTNWLNMIYPRLRLAANLLTDDGVIFISIDDNEVHNLRKVCDEVFGEENFVAELIWEKKKKPSFLNMNLGTKTEYILCFAKRRENTSAFSVDTTEQGKKYPLNNAGNTIKDLVFKPKSVRFNMVDSIIPPQDMSEGVIKTELLNQLVIKDGYNENEFTLRGEWRYSQQKLNKIIKNNESIVISKIPFRPNHIKSGGEIKKMHNLLSINHYSVGTNEDATMEQIDIFDANYFDYAKPVGLISFLIKAVTYDSPDSIILDFFSGSATTAHAVMQLNADDGGNRKFICVQLPEVCDEKSEAYKAGYANICEIGKERIRRAGALIGSREKGLGDRGQGVVGREKGLGSREKGLGKRDQGVENDLFSLTPKSSTLCPETTLTPETLDTGFRVFKLDTSNLKTWDATPIDNIDLFTERMNEMIDTIKPDRTELDMVYEVMLKMGVPLTYPVDFVEIGGKRAYSIGSNCELLVCLQEGLTAEMIEQMATDYLPSKIILNEKCFSDDTAMANAHYILKERAIELKLV